ncbi:hypothetical protein EYF80_006011 [Liparis tanakae]|uniref:Uncharacterized protein n=1 Tax=Liparis tanakae TaxID=230148 RepID=A0A4Z2J0H9_9TELE|nr:hypothetical protein EYF80_006011 [Liparis tanakae]
MALVLHRCALLSASFLPDGGKVHLPTAATHPDEPACRLRLRRRAGSPNLYTVQWSAFHWGPSDRTSRPRGYRTNSCLKAGRNMETWKHGILSHVSASSCATGAMRGTRSTKQWLLTLLSHCVSMKELESLSEPRWNSRSHSSMELLPIPSTKRWL